MWKLTTFIKTFSALTPVAASPWNAKRIDDLRGPLTDAPTHVSPALRAREIRANTCGYAEGASLSSITCSNTNLICATNTYFGVHGCCDPSSLSACTIPTTCIASTAMSTLCTNDACSTDNAITKCTASELRECYMQRFVYDTTILTQHGCAATGFTVTILRTYGGGQYNSAGISSTRTVTAPIVTAPSPADIRISTYTEIQTAYVMTRLPEPGGGGDTNLGAIVGGAVGGFAALSATGFGIYFVRRKLKKDKARQALDTRVASPLVERPGKEKIIYGQIEQCELPEQSVVEMSQPPQELDGSTITHETSASPVDIRRPHVGRRASF